MELQHQNTENTAADLLTYLPVLKQKFTNSVGKTNEMEQILIDSAFENYKLYLLFRQNNNMISVESTQQMKKLGESDHIQMASMALYYNKIIIHCKKGNFIEVDTQLLKEIFQFYRESMLHFKFQKVAFKAIKASLSNILKA
jgi:hypothetical protein